MLCVHRITYQEDQKIADAGTFTLLKEDHTLGNIIRMSVCPANFRETLRLKESRLAPPRLTCSASVREHAGSLCDSLSGDHCLAHVTFIALGQVPSGGRSRVVRRLPHAAPARKPYGHQDQNAAGLQVSDTNQPAQPSRDRNLREIRAGRILPPSDRTFLFPFPCRFPLLLQARQHSARALEFAQDRSQLAARSIRTTVSCSLSISLMRHTRAPLARTSHQCA